MKLIARALSLPGALLLFATAAFLAPTANAADHLIAANNWAGENRADLLVMINPANASLIAGRDVKMPGYRVGYLFASAKQPGTGVIYAAAYLRGLSVVHLVTLEPVSGVATDVAQLGVGSIASMAFAADGTLYGVTGHSASSPSALYTINTSNGAMTWIAALTNGDYGNAIAYNPDDGLLYHATGMATNVFESINPANSYALSTVTLSGDDMNAVTGLVYAGSGVFYAFDQNPANAGLPRLFTLTTSGAASYVGSTANGAGGLAVRGPLLTAADIQYGDVGISTTPPSAVPLGSNTTLPVQVTNLATAEATGVQASVDLSGLTSLITFVSSSGDATCAFSTPIVTCDFGSVAASSSESASLVFTLNGPNTSYINVYVRSDTWDTAVANNWTVPALPVSPADVGVTVVDGKSPVKPGKTVTFSATVTNQGPSRAVDVWLDADVPVGTTFKSASDSSCYLDTSVVHCDLGDMLNGASTTISFSFDVTATGKATLTETVSLISANDTNAANDTATITKRVVGKLR